MSVITRKIQILVSESDTKKRKEYYNQLREWSNISRNYANESMCILQSTYFLDNMVKSNTSEVNKPLNEYLEISKKGLGYKMLVNKYKSLLPSTFRAGINSYVYKNFGNTIKDVLKGDASIISYKKDFPLFFDKRTIKNLTITNKDSFFEFFSIPFKINFGKDKSNNKSIVTKVMTGEYTMGDSSFKFVDKKLFMYLVVKIPDKKFEMVEDKVLGVDLGIEHPAYVSINTDKKFKKAIGTKESFLHTRLGLQKHKRNLQKNLRYTKGGKGRGKKLKKLEDIGKKERNFANTMNHTFAKEIVKIAVSNNCDTINLEDLKGFGKSEKNSFVLRQWSYFELQSLIDYKAKAMGIKVNKINASYSSQRCHQCGFIHTENRISQSIFNCQNCGYEDNADFNASKNISIAHTKEYQKQIEKHVKTLKNLDENLTE